MLNMLTLLTYESVGDLNKPCQYSPMFGRQERVAILLLLGVAVVVISAHLALGTFGKQPFAHTFAENSADGELVSASGIVEQISYTKNGGHMNLYLNTTTIFIPAQVAQDLILNKGDSISVYGIVQTYRGKKEIVISSKKDIFIIPDNKEKNSLHTPDL
jgi:DNA/RNA endonuclease YhcR with UshA esterase domain